MSSRKEYKFDSKYPVDIARAKGLLDGDWEIFEELLDIFIEHVPDQIESIENALSGGRAEDVRFFAHQLKGALRNFAAEYASSRAYELEKMGVSGKITEGEKQLEVIKREIKVIEEYHQGKEWKNFL